MASFVSHASTPGLKERKREKKSRWKQWPASLPSATTGGACKPPGPIRQYVSVRANLDFCRHVLKHVEIFWSLCSAWRFSVIFYYKFFPNFREQAPVKIKRSLIARTFDFIQSSSGILKHNYNINFQKFLYVQNSPARPLILFVCCLGCDSDSPNLNH